MDIHEVKDGKIMLTWHTEDWISDLPRLGVFEKYLFLSRVAEPATHVGVSRINVELRAPISACPYESMK